MQVEAADIRVPEQHGPAPVGLQPVLVRVDHHRVAPGDGPPRRLVLATITVTKGIQNSTVVAAAMAVRG